MAILRKLRALAGARIPKPYLTLLPMIAVDASLVARASNPLELGSFCALILIGSAALIKMVLTRKARRNDATPLMEKPAS